MEARGGIVSEGCHPGCVIKCSQVYNSADGKQLTAGFEYETLWAFGAHTTIKDIDDIAMMDRLCDDYGVDTIDTGVAIGIAMEGGLLEWGDGKAAIELIKEIAKGTGNGKNIGQWCGIYWRCPGRGPASRGKTTGIPAYDPRAVKGVGITYATTPMGADHTAGYGVTANILKVGGDIDPLKKEGNIELSQNLQIATAAIDAAGLCLFVAFAVLDNEDGVQTIVDLINAQHGLSLTPDDVVSLGKSILNDEKEFNKRAGFTKLDDQLPDMFDEKLPPHNVDWGFSTDELQETLNF